MNERQVVEEYEAMLTRRNKEIVRQGVYKVHGMQRGREYLMALHLAKHHTIANVLWIHKLIEFTLYAQQGHDLVHDETIDAAALFAQNSQPHTIATIMHSRYLLAHARLAGIPATLHQMIHADPVTDAATRYGLVPAEQARDSSDLGHFVEGLLSTSRTLWHKPGLIANKRYPSSGEHQSLDPRPPRIETHTTGLMTHAEHCDILPRVRDSIRATWQESNFGNLITVSDGVMTLDRGDGSPKERTPLLALFGNDELYLLED